MATPSRRSDSIELVEQESTRREFKMSQRSGVICGTDLMLAKECRGVLTQHCPGWKGAESLKSVSPLGPSDCPSHCTLDKERSR